MLRTVGVVLAHKGVGHLTEGLLILHNLMGDAGINDEYKINIIRSICIYVYMLLIDLNHVYTQVFDLN